MYMNLYLSSKPARDSTHAAHTHRGCFAFLYPRVRITYEAQSVLDGLFILIIAMLNPIQCKQLYPLSSTRWSGNIFI